MRILVVLLLTANLLFVAWLLWWPKEPPPPRAAPLAASPLVLLDELPASAIELQESGPAVSVPPVAGAADAAVCQSLGPYLDREVAMSARVRLEDVGVYATPRAVDASQRLGFWVHTPAAASREQADMTIERLRRAGIRDYYVVADGEYRNAVSLGVFSQRQSADQHAARLSAMGFEVEVGERRREITAWWLDFAAPAPGSVGAARVAEIARLGDDALVLQAGVCD